MKISVLGCGRWGSFLAWYTHTLGHETLLYGRAESPRFQRLRATRANDYLQLPSDVELCDDIRQALGFADMVIASVGAQSFRALCREMRRNTARNDIVYTLCMKGMEQDTGKRLTQVFAEEMGSAPVCVWVGPGHVEDFLRGVPNCMVIDSANKAVKRDAVDALSGSLIRFYYGEDLIGNEIGAATKNIIGLAAGLLDGLELTSLKGALMARAPREIARLTAALGGDPQTPYGLSHLGDYEATLFSHFSHNRAFGENFTHKKPYDKLAEGVYTLKAVMRIAEERALDLPICAALHQAIYENVDPRAALNDLFLRPLRREFYY